MFDPDAVSVSGNLAGPEGANLVHLPPALGVLRPGPAADVYALRKRSRVCCCFYIDKQTNLSKCFGMLVLLLGVGRAECPVSEKEKGLPAERAESDSV